MSRERTREEHIDHLFEEMAHLGWLHTHVTKEEFESRYILSLVEPDEKDFDPLEMFAELNGVKAREDSNSAHDRELDRKNASARQERHEGLMEKWDPGWWGSMP